MRTFHTQMQQLATTFADAILDAIRGSSLQDLVGAAPPKVDSPEIRAMGAKTTESSGHLTRTSSTKRLKRRNSTEIEQALAQVVATVKKSKTGLRAEQIRAELGLQQRELPRVLKEGLSTRKLRKTGEKRSTVYTA